MHKLLDDKGSMLALAVIYMFICTIIGYGLLRLSLADQIEVVNAAQSMQAFWLAEAGIEKAALHLPNTYIPSWLINQPLGSGEYNITEILKVGTSPDRYCRF